MAEILHELLPIMEELGIKHDWKVIPLDETSGYFTARLVDLLQGYGMGAFPEAEKNIYLEKLRRTVFCERDTQADMYFIHDFQLAPLAEFFSWMRLAAWFCHVDTAHPNPTAQQYLRQFLDPYAVVCFNSHASVFKDLPPEKTDVVTLGIDPFRVKNRFLPKARGVEILDRCGIDTQRPLISQISRFGVWKNPWQAIETETAAAYTLKLLQDRELWRRLGGNAHESVRKRFLFPTMILGYLQALQRVSARVPADSEPETVPIETAAARAEVVA